MVWPGQKGELIVTELMKDTCKPSPALLHGAFTISTNIFTS